MSQQGSVELDSQVARVVIPDRVPHGNHRRHTTLKQRVCGTGIAGILLKRDGFRLRDGRTVRARPFTLRNGEHIVPVLDVQYVARVASAQEEETWDEATGLNEEIQQFPSRDRVAGPARCGKFEEIHVSVTAPMDDVIAAIFLDLCF